MTLILKPSEQNTFLFLLCLSSLLFVLAACSTSSSSSPLRQINTPDCSTSSLLPLTKFKIFKAAEEKAIAIVLHGMNNRPQIMDPLVTELNSLNISVLRLTLSGHEESNADNWKIVSRDNWIEDLTGAFCYAKQNFGEKPVYAVGYSIGAVITLAFLDRYPQAKFDKLIFFAPAITPNYKKYLVEFLYFIDIFNSSLPSYTPEIYRMHDSTPLRNYNQMFKLIDSIQTISPKSSLHQTHGLIFYSAEDELISFSKLNDWMMENKINKLELKEISPKPLDSSAIYHLILNESTVGTEAWTSIRSNLKLFLVEN